MFPRWKDVNRYYRFLKYALFITNEKPKHERFHWREKVDYLADAAWGIPLLGVTGVFLWNPEWATSFLPGWAITMSYIAHLLRSIFSCLG